jgi:multidrug efflux system outer membrane protein
MPVPPQPPAGLPSELLARRPDVRQAEEQLVAANAQIGVARAAMLPSISLTGAFGGQSIALSDLLSDRARIWSLGFGLSLPIFDGGRLEARSDQAVARDRQALAAYQGAAQNAFREVSDALIVAQAARDAEADTRARAQATARSLQLSQMRYEAGYSAYLEVLDAQRSANAAELDVVRNRQTRLNAAVDLFKALSGGWPDSQSGDAVPAAASR